MGFCLEFPAYAVGIVELQMAGHHGKFNQSMEAAGSWAWSEIK